MHDLDVRREPYKFMEGSKTFCDAYRETSNTGACVLNPMYHRFVVCSIRVLWYMYNGSSVLLCLSVPFLCNGSCMAVIHCIY